LSSKSRIDLLIFLIHVGTVTLFTTQCILTPSRRRQMRKIVLASISIALATTTGGCDATTRTVTGGLRLPPRSCALRATGFSTLADVLNRAETCVEVLRCPHGIAVSDEVKELAGDTLRNWLWYQPTPRSITFSVEDESRFRRVARERAIAALPPGKMLLEIEYFTGVTGPNQRWALILGARGHYGGCRGPPT
jgi:hypothetical protein